MAGWTRAALEEALGDRYTESTTADGMHAIRWECDGGAITAAAALRAEHYALDVGCAHRAHRELLEYPVLKITQIALVDPAGAHVKTLPQDAAGYRLIFRLEGPKLHHPALVRVESAELDAPDLERVEEFRAGTYAEPRTFEVALHGVARGQRDLSIHVLDPKTAKHNWGADGVRLGHVRVPLENVAR